MGKKDVIDSRFEKVFADPRFASTHRRNVVTGEVEQEATLFNSGHPNKGDEDNFEWDAVSTSDSDIDSVELAAEEISAVKEKLAKEAWGAYGLTEEPRIRKANQDVENHTSATENDTHIPQGDSTARLALMGFDWVNIKAEDLFVLCHTSIDDAKEINQGDKILSSVIKSCAIYKSDFGHQALENERVNGPSFEELELIQKKCAEMEELEGEVTEATALALRKYEKQRSMYYYAVVECHSVQIADHLYNSLDGMDADFSVDGIDVRFVPDDLREFPRPPEAVCTELPKNYTAPEAFQSNSRHTRAELHWDETDKRREKILTKRFTDAEMNELDLKDYFAASGSEDEAAVDPERVAEMRKLLLGNTAAESNIRPIEGEFEISSGSNPRKVERSSSDSEGEEEAKDKAHKTNGFSLLLAGDGSESDDDVVDVELNGPVHIGEESSEDEAKPKNSSRKQRVKEKERLAKLEHKAKKREQIVDEAVVEDVKKDSRFKELFSDPKHFVDCTEASKKKRRRK